LLIDYRQQTGYRYVYCRRGSNRYCAEFVFGPARVHQYGFGTPRQAAKFVAQWFRDLYGDEWHEWADPKKYGLIQGAGWKVVTVGRFFAGDVCLSGRWYRVDYKRTEIFAKPTQAVNAVRALVASLRRLCPLFRERVMIPMPYRKPTLSVRIPAMPITSKVPVPPPEKRASHYRGGSHRHQSTGAATGAGSCCRCLFANCS
jgi:hypothetical protein